MRTIVPAAIAFAALSPTWAVAQQTKAPPKKSPELQRPVQACPEFGAGFVKVAGTGTCVKIGGYVRHESSRSR